MRRIAISCTLAVGLIVAVILFLSGCSGKSGSSMNSSVPATVNMTVSDPATCSGPRGPFSHIYVTITDVQINASSSAGDNDPGWIDLTPKLQQNPQQVENNRERQPQRDQKRRLRRRLLDKNNLALDLKQHLIQMEAHRRQVQLIQFLLQSVRSSESDPGA